MISLYEALQTLDYASKTFCSLIPLLRSLQDADPFIIESPLKKARGGKIPSQNPVLVNRCSPLPFTYTAKNCSYLINGYDAVQIMNTHWKSRYHFWRARPLVILHLWSYWAQELMHTAHMSVGHLPLKFDPSSIMPSMIPSPCTWWNILQESETNSDATQQWNR